MTVLFILNMEQLGKLIDYHLEQKQKIKPWPSLTLNYKNI